MNTRSATTVSPNPPARPTPRRWREELSKLLFVIPAMLMMGVLFVYPVGKNVVMSLQEYTLQTFFTGEAPFVGLDNYRAVIGDRLFSKALMNTVVFTVVSIVGQFVIGMALAVFFRKKFPLAGPIRALFLLPWLMPLIVSSTSWRSILDQDNGVLNSTLMRLHLIDDPVQWLSSPDVALLSVILVNIWIGIPFNITLLYSGLHEIPDELYEAAAIDGATGWKTFRYITWPNLRPVVAVVLALGVVYSLRVLDVILGVTGGGPANATQTLATQSYEHSFVDFRFGEGAALSNILILISLVFAFVYMRATRRQVDE